ncbi:MAG: hypothetical protein ABEI06_00650 [Halobacteriaceae archaeon]
MKFRTQLLAPVLMLLLILPVGLYMFNRGIVVGLAILNIILVSLSLYLSLNPSGQQFLSKKSPI